MPVIYEKPAIGLKAANLGSLLFLLIYSELSVSIVDETLSSTVAKNIKKAVKLFCMKCEQLVSTGGEATQVIGNTVLQSQLHSYSQLNIRARDLTEHVSAPQTCRARGKC